MQIHLIAVGTRMPAWVTTGYEEYARRMPRACRLVLTEISPALRSRNRSTAQVRDEEGQRMLAAIPRDALVIALDERGKCRDTQALARELEDWLAGGRDVALLVGGADGLAPACRAAAASSWSLSAHTFPHALVRVLLAEQLYRAWTVTRGHPYHRS